MKKKAILQARQQTQMSANSDLEACIDWCRTNGSYVDDRIVFKLTEKVGITAVASEAISTKKPLISIPKKLLITNEIAMKHFDITEPVVSRGNPNVLGQLLTAKLKFGSDEECFHRPYIRILPLKLDQPYFWSADQLEILKGTDLHLMLRQNLAKMASEWIDVLEFLKLKPNDMQFYNKLKSSQDIDILSLFLSMNEISIGTSWLSFPAYVWATSIFNSRAFPEIIMNSQTSNINQAFLYPIVDLLNHKNDTKVKWVFENDEVSFISLESLKKSEEIFNSYGDKSNEELLLNYGFVQENNANDFTRLSLKLEKQMLDNASSFGIDIKDHIVADDCVQFKLTNEQPLPDSLLEMFNFLCKLKSESQLTLRGALEGQDELHEILIQKVDFFKKRSKINRPLAASTDLIATIKQYLNSDRRIYNNSLEALQKLQKQTMRKNAISMTSFKTIFKNDKEFANSLLIAFGIANFEDFAKQGCMREALLLWIVRVANKDSYPRKLSYAPPRYIYDCFQEVNRSIVIQKEDVMEFMSFYKKLFPNLSKKIPETFDVGNWGIRQFIVADNVMDRLVWTRKQTQEPYFILQNKI